MLSNVKIHSKSMLNMALTVEWKSEHVTHKDVRVFERYNVWRDLDLMPVEIQKELPGKSIGFKNTYRVVNGELVAPWQSSQFHTIQSDQFKTNLKQGCIIHPHVGRFYPQGYVGGVRDVYSDNMHPCRLVAIEEDKMAFDFNHPLSQYPMTIGIEVFGVSDNMGEHGGRCNDAIADLLNGPGMQARYQQVVTDFFDDISFRRFDEAADGLFYAPPRMVEHLDRFALEHVENLYGQLVPENSKVLDLMASCNSHLPETLHACHVTGLGLNQQELESNKVLNERVIHDLNDDTSLPFEDAAFDVVICTVSVEYLIKPFEIFSEVARVLKPGGKFINVFSNRWFPPKAIAIWNGLHDFERIGLVAEYYLQSKQFTDINTYSFRGLSRPVDDAHIMQTGDSDPIYAVWGIKE